MLPYRGRPQSRSEATAREGSTQRSSAAYADRDDHQFYRPADKAESRYDGPGLPHSRSGYEHRAPPLTSIARRSLSPPSAGQTVPSPTLYSAPPPRLDLLPSFSRPSRSQYDWPPRPSVYSRGTIHDQRAPPLPLALSRTETSLNPSRSSSRPSPTTRHHVVHHHPYPAPNEARHGSPRRTISYSEREPTDYPPSTHSHIHYAAYPPTPSARSEYSFPTATRAHYEAPVAPQYVRSPSNEYRYHEPVEGSNSASQMTSDASGKRFRISRACQHCKARKTRCDAIGALRQDLAVMESGGGGSSSSAASTSGSGLHRYDPRDDLARLESGSGSVQGDETSNAAMSASDMVVIQPCTNCVRAGVECAYSQRQLKRGPSKGYVKQLERRLDSLEQSLLERVGASVEDETARATLTLQEKADEGMSIKPEERLAHLESLLESTKDRNGEEALAGGTKREKTETHRFTPTSSSSLGHSTQERRHRVDSTTRFQLEPFNQADEAREILEQFSRTLLHRSLPLLSMEDAYQTDVDWAPVRKAIRLLDRPPDMQFDREEQTAHPDRPHLRGSPFGETIGMIIYGREADRGRNDRDDLRHTTEEGSFLTRSINLIGNDRIERQHGIEADALILCYLDSLRNARPAGTILAAAVQRINECANTNAFASERLSESIKKKAVVAMVVDSWHSIAMNSPRTLIVSGTSFMTKSSIDDLTTLLLGSESHVDDGSQAADILRGAMMFGFARSSVEDDGCDDGGLTDEALQESIERADLSDGQKPNRSALRSVLHIYKALRNLPAASHNTDLAFIEHHVRLAHELLALLHADDAPSIVNTFVIVTMLSLVAALLAWDGLALAAFASDETSSWLSLTRREPSAAAAAAHADVVDSVEKILVRAEEALQMIASIARIAYPQRGMEQAAYRSGEGDNRHPEPGEASSHLSADVSGSFAPVCERVAIFSQATARALDTLFGRDQDSRRVTAKLTEPPVFQTPEASWDQVNAFAKAVQRHGPLGVVLAATDAGLARTAMRSKTYRERRS